MQHERDMPFLGTVLDEGLWRAQRCADMLADREKAYHQGLLLAAADAVLICHMWRQPPPDWLPDAVAVAISRRTTKIEKKRRRQDMIHYARWSAVQALRERRNELLRDFGDDSGMTWEKCWAMVSTLLENTDAAGSEDTIKASYALVQRDGGTGRFLMLSPRIDETCGPLTFTTKRDPPKA
jgi:hypothetical protein